MNFTTANLKKLETLIREGGYVLRYEKGNFNSGYCILLDKNVVIINKYFTDDVKFQKLLEIIQTMNFQDKSGFTENTTKLYEKLGLSYDSSTEIDFPDEK